MEKVPGVRRLKYAQPTERLTLACGSMVLAPIWSANSFRRLSQSRSLGFLVRARTIALRAQKLDLWASLIVFDVTPKATGTTSPCKILIFFLFFFFPFSFLCFRRFYLFAESYIRRLFNKNALKYCLTILYYCTGSQQQASKGTRSAWRDLQVDGQFKRLG